MKKELQTPKIQVNTPTDNRNDKSLSSKDAKNTLMANGFLNDQETIKEQTSLHQVSNAKKNIEDKKSVVSIKQSAEMLDLNPDEISIENMGSKGETKAELFAKNNTEFNQSFFQQKSLNKMIIDNETYAKESVSKEVVSKAQTESTSNSPVSDVAKATAKEATVTLNVPQNVVETIQSKIIGAQQKMGSFMSDVARNMYLNYKPPFTAFRMSLNPANLGSISVMMRASKADNSITVSMNMNNSNTMEAFADNKVALQNALQKQLGEGSNVSLNFGMQNDNTNSPDNFSENNSGNSKQNSSKNENIVTHIEEVENETEDSNYM